PRCFALVPFLVVLGAPRLQGLTRRPLLMKLVRRGDDRGGQGVTRARLIAYRAALASLDGEQSRLAEALRVELEDALVQANGQAAASDPETSADGLRLRAVKFRQKARCLPCATVAKSAMRPSTGSHKRWIQFSLTPPNPQHS